MPQGIPFKIKVEETDMSDIVEIPDDAADSILTVGDAVKFIEKAQA